MIGDCFESTSTINKIKIDIQLRKKIKIDSNSAAIMLVGSPDGLERHYENMIGWGGKIENLVIVDICEQTINNLRRFHEDNLNEYPLPRFVTADLNQFLSEWNGPQIGVIDFDGTTGITKYHLETIEHAERLKAEYLILVSSSRIQDRDILVLGSDAKHEVRRKYVNKAEQLRTRGYYSPSYTILEKVMPRAQKSFEYYAECRGHETVVSLTYKGVSPMSLSLFKLNKLSFEDYIKSLSSVFEFGEQLMPKLNMEKLVKYNAANSVKQHLEFMKTDEYKDLVKCKRDNNGLFHPSKEWQSKYQEAA